MGMVKRRMTKSGPRWDVAVYLGGERPYLYKTFKTKGAADAEERAQETKKAKGETPTVERRTLAEYCADWLKRKADGAVMDRNGKRKKIGPRTFDDYRRLLTEWIIEPRRRRDRLAERVFHDLPGLGRCRLDKLTYPVLDAFYDEMRKVTEVGTVRKLNRLLGQVLHEVVRDNVLSRNAAEWAHVPQPDSEDEDDDDAAAKAMNEKQAAEFLAAARELADAQEQDHDELTPERCWSALWHVLLCAGLRPGEAFALRWKEDVNEETHEVHVHHSLVRVRGVKGYELRRPKTKKSRRTVPLPETAWAELMNWKTQQKRQRLIAGDTWQDLGFVFTTSKGTPLHGGRRSFARVSAKVELGTFGPKRKREHLTGPVPQREFTPWFRIYDLRHTFVTLQLMHGVPVNVVADRAGHVNAAFTIARYGHALPKQQKEATEKLQTLLFKMA